MIMKKALPTWRCVAAVVAAAAITSGESGANSTPRLRQPASQPGFVARTDLPLRRLIRFPSRSLMRPARLCRGYGEPDMDGAPNHG